MSTNTAKISNKTRNRGMAVALTLLTALLSGQAMADCASQEQYLMNRLQSLATGPSENSICGTTRRLIPVMRETVQYYRSCPMADPTGEMARHVARSLESALETERAACAN